MASPLLTSLPAPPEELAKDALLATLRDDPTLLLQNVTIWGLEGNSAQTPEVQQTVLSSLLPLVRVSIHQVADEEKYEGAYRSLVQFKFECFCLGTHDSDHLRLWAAVRHALFPTDPTRKAVVQGRFGAVAGLIFDRKVSRNTKPVHVGQDQYATKTEGFWTLGFDIAF